MTQLITLQLPFEMGEIKFYIYPVVIKSYDDLILIDTGFPMFLSLIEKAFEKNGLDIRKLRQVVLTHHDHDHMGAVKELVKKYPSVKVKCSAEQMPYILGKKKPLRLEHPEKLAADTGLIQMIKSVEHLDSALAVADNETICDGVKVIETSGHMPGHISIYIESVKTLISGDLLICENGALSIADERFVLDKEAEISSIRKIANLDIEKIICFHGGEYKSSNLKEELKKIIEKGYKS